MPDPIILETAYGPIKVEATDSGIAYRGDVPAEKKKQKMEEAIETVSAVGNSFVKAISGLAEAPKEFQLQFGLKFSAETGVLVAKTNLEASFTISLKWEREGK